LFDGAVVVEDKRGGGDGERVSAEEAVGGLGWGRFVGGTPGAHFGLLLHRQDQLIRSVIEIKDKMEEVCGRRSPVVDPQKLRAFLQNPWPLI